MNKYFYTFLFLIAYVPIFAQNQSILGKWYTFDSKKNRETIVEVYKTNDKFYAKIIDILQEEDSEKVCENCTGENKNKPIKGLIVVEDVVKDGDEWNGGTVLDPLNGKYYNCYISLINENELKVRGYIGFSIFGRSMYLERVIN